MRKNFLRQQEKILKSKKSVVEFYEETKFLLKLKKISLLFTDKYINNVNTYRPSLALAGFYKIFPSNRILIFGKTEYYFIIENGIKCLKKFLDFVKEIDFPCIIFSNNCKLPEDFIKLFQEYKINIFVSELDTDLLFHHLNNYLWKEFSDKIIFHGSFVDVFGIGILITGEPGIGKSETALELVKLNHRLVADDIIIIRKNIDGKLIGSSTEIIQDFIELRGIGIVNLRELFGLKSILNEKRIDIIVNLEYSSNQKKFERLGMNMVYEKILNIDVPFYSIPIRAGKNNASIIETIALAYSSRLSGYNPAMELENRILKTQQKKTGVDIENERG